MNNKKMKGWINKMKRGMMVLMVTGLLLAVPGMVPAKQKVPGMMDVFSGDFDFSMQQIYRAVDFAPLPGSEVETGMEPAGPFFNEDIIYNLYHTVEAISLPGGTVEVGMVPPLPGDEARLGALYAAVNAGAEAALDLDAGMDLEPVVFQGRELQSLYAAVKEEAVVPASVETGFGREMLPVIPVQGRCAPEKVQVIIRMNGPVIGQLVKKMLPEGSKVSLPAEARKVLAIMEEMANEQETRMNAHCKELEVLKQRLGSLKLILESKVRTGGSR